MGHNALVGGSLALGWASPGHAAGIRGQNPGSKESPSDKNATDPTDSTAKNEDPQDEQEKKDTPLTVLEAAKKGDYTAVKKLAFNDAPVNDGDENGVTPLMWAAYPPWTPKCSRTPHTKKPKKN